uniref:Plethodontid modulating factor n=1 Tax=Plethodon shermani TaxID=263671 RepID=Q0GB59_9SALA|nr:plethodontid modulating factor [Plethodon shermani]AEO22623.1 plethodontid modulating factor precursor [Plethodon shermani]
MRTTALLILLVVLVSTGEALRCKTLNENSDFCPPGNDEACMLYKSTGMEFMGCATQRFCDAMEAGLAEEGLEDSFMCCTGDVCN